METLDQPVAGPSGPITRGIESLCRWFAVVGFALFVGESLLSVASVIGRATISRPIPGDYELVQMVSAMGIAMCLPFCELARGHVFVDFFTARVPAGGKRLLDGLAAVLLAGVAFLLAWRTLEGMTEMRAYGESSMVLGLPVWWGYVPLIPSFVLLGFAALVNLRRLYAMAARA